MSTHARLFAPMLCAIQNRGQSDTSKTVDESDEQRLVLRASPQSSASSSILDTDSGDGFTSFYRVRPVRWCAGYPLPLHSNPNPPTSWFLDPFFTLPGTSELPSMVAHLVYYWKTIFVPMTFPNTSKDSNQEMELMVRSSFSDPGSFFGLMSMCAAHRAVLASQRSGNWDSVLTDDPDYCMMRAKSIQEMSAKVRDPSRRLSNEAFDTIINLLTGSLIIGEFSEVHTHLTGLKSMVDLRGGITDESIRSSSMLSAIITTDIKAASGLMTQPVFPLTWDAQPIPSEIQQRIRPPASSPLNRLGTGFSANTFLSPSLLKIISVLRDMVFFSITYQTNPTAIKPGDQDFFRILNCEAEHQLLSYIYAEGSSDPEPNIHPIEAVSRVACICYLNHFLIVSPSSSGLGRALTKHLKTALDSCKLSLLVGLPNQNFGLYVWALFVGAQGALGQPERQWFVERLARVAMVCGWQSWEQISKLMAGFFFVAALDSLNWRSIWDEAMTGFVISESEEVEFSSLLGTGVLSLN
ncbi:Pc13g05820 [Penicillium rubens Wisconsin 54-1255]|uniref:Pc13g05820 protein n=1 Tax=Penicillium rubens (strain ATCC 28089 / DSM 1075 / NRRL 1951 / Wisconsin 54-1255) TaxID=500485 RepID=B6H2Y3_PENRW|nr:Pc13g05820 [Penicillium rubens Wisconsin 54-1255]